MSENLLHQSDNIKFFSNTRDIVNIFELSDNKKLILIGNIHALFYENSVIKFSKDKLVNELIKKIIKNNELDKINEFIEGSYIGLIFSPNGDYNIFSDKFNRKELFYICSENSLYASTLIAPLINFVKDKNYDQTALANILSVYGNYSPKKHTLYKDIRRLGVGEFISFKNGSLNIEEIRFNPEPIKNYQKDKLEDYYNLFHSSIEIRSSDNMNWVFMSSGWDSSSVLSMLCKIHGSSKVRAVIGKFKYSNKSGVNNNFEIERAKKITDYFNVPLDIVDIDYTVPDYLLFWEEIRESFKSSHLYALFTYNFFRLAKHVSHNGQLSDVIFNGEVSDGAHNLGFSQFATILNHSDLSFREYSDKMASYLYSPSFYRKILKDDFTEDSVFKLIKSHKNEMGLGSIKNLSDKEWKNKYISSFLLSSNRMPFSESVNSKLLTTQGAKSFEEEINEKYFDSFSDNVTDQNLYGWFLHLYNSFHWQGSTVRGMMTSPEHYNLKNGSPFWDSRIQNFLSSMPESWGRGLDLNPTKYPLKWVLQNKLDYPFHLQSGPHSYLYDINPSWNANADIIYDSAGMDFFKKLLKKRVYEEVLSSDYFDLKYINKLTDDYCSGNIEKGQKLDDLKNIISVCNVGWY